MMDFDPRDLDDERPVSHGHGRDRRRGGGETRPTLGRGPSSADRETERPSREQVIDLRDREHERREQHRDGTSRDVFERHVDLPRGPEREVVYDGRREYTLRRSETRTLLVTFTAPLARFTRAYQTLVREELESPLTEEDVQGLWRLFLRRRTGATEPMGPPLPGVAAGYRLFASPRFSAGAPGGTRSA